MNFKHTDFLTDDFAKRFLMSAEGDPEPEGGSGSGEGEEGTQAAVHGDAGANGDGDAGGDAGADPKKPEADAKSDDWRAGITDPDARKLADSSTDLNHFAQRTLEMRQKLSSAILRPGKNAKPEEVAAYRKALEIPEEPSGYEFPDLPEGMELTDEVKLSRDVWGQRFHELGIPAPAAKELARLVNEDAAEYQKMQVEADKKFAADAEADLKKEWPGEEYAKNREFVNRAVAQFGGDDLDDLRQLELKNGRFLFDDPRMMKLMARVGREMDEGSMGDVLSGNERDSLETQVRELREKQSEAKDKGDNRLADKLYQQEQEILKKMHGNQAIVGAQGRAA